MKSKDRVTLMICTAADGTKVTLSIIGKAKKTDSSSKLAYDVCPSQCDEYASTCRYGHASQTESGLQIGNVGKASSHFDLEGGFQQAVVSCGHQRRGCKGLAYGGKAHILR
eukprot:scaffold27994_cov49-Attheya_sp.AAC.4